MTVHNAAEGVLRIMLHPLPQKVHVIHIRCSLVYRRSPTKSDKVPFNYSTWREKGISLEASEQGANGAAHGHRPHVGRSRARSSLTRSRDFDSVFRSSYLRFHGRKQVLPASIRLRGSSRGTTRPLR